jgi:hypothetical protein
MFRMGKYIVGVVVAGAVLVPGVAVAAPGDGTVVIREQVSGSGGGTFGYQSELAPGGRFALAGGGQVAFTRVAGEYTVKEIVPAGWSLSGIGCGISRPGGGFPRSGLSVDFGAGEVDVTLAAGDVVTCTYTNGQG